MATTKKNAQDNSAQNAVEIPQKKGEQNYNSTFEEWKVASSKNILDQKTGEYEWNFDKVKHIKDVAIPSDMAERLNENSQNSKIRYYAK